MTADEPGNPSDRFDRAAIEWPGGARGQDLVDATALALAEGLDSPTLRVLAGAPRASADDEVTDLAPTAFDELHLRVQPCISAAALVDARFVVGDLLWGHRTSKLCGVDHLCRTSALKRGSPATFAGTCQSSSPSILPTGSPATSWRSPSVIGSQSAMATRSSRPSAQ